MESFVGKLIEWFALPSHGLGSVFLIAFIGATLLPLASEPAVFAYVKLNPDQFLLTCIVATLGGTLGGIVDYWLGYGAKKAVSQTEQTRYLKWFERLGPKALFFSFLPAVGDPICSVAGWLRMAFWPCVFWMALGKFARYAIMTALLMWVPDSFWQGGLEFIRRFMLG